MASSANGRPRPEGLRERKRRETAARIAEAGLRLFIAHGYDATTLDDIAAEAGISRRTFFYYFKSKDDILLSMQSGFDVMIAAAIGDQPAGKSPIDTARDALMAIAARYPADDMIMIDKLMRSSPAVMARKQATYVEQEQQLFAALHERWPDPERRPGLRSVAMIAIGAMRLALDIFHQEKGARPIADVFREVFDTIHAEV